MTRYSGHLFSRLAVYVLQHDQTKTIAYLMRGKPEQPFKLNVFNAQLMMFGPVGCVPLWFLRLNVEIYLCLVCLSQWDGWLVLDRVIDAPVLQVGLTWDRWCQAVVKFPRKLFGLLSQTPTVLAVTKNVDYLLIAKPVALNHLRIRCGWALFMKWGRLLVVLSEDHDLCCMLWLREVCLKFVRPGNKVVWPLLWKC